MRNTHKSRMSVGLISFMKCSVKGQCFKPLHGSGQILIMFKGSGKIQTLYTVTVKGLVMFFVARVLFYLAPQSTLNFKKVLNDICKILNRY